MLLPFAGRPEKEWPIEHFRELAKRLGPKALVVWGPRERERAAAIGAELAPATNLRELARVLRDASIVIGGDTGPLHLAAALGTRVIGLYGPTNPARNGPYGQVHRALASPDGTMTGLAVEIVFRAVVDALGRETSPIGNASRDGAAGEASPSKVQGSASRDGAAGEANPSKVL